MKKTHTQVFLCRSYVVLCRSYVVLCRFMSFLCRSYVVLMLFLCYCKIKNNLKNNIF
jgi:hypothetical protein